MKKNLYDETVSVLFGNHKSTEDVMFVTNGVKSTSWEEFAKLIKNVVYDGGYGSQEISGALRIVGDRWWLERSEYDGSEWWEYKTVIEQPPVGEFVIDDIIDLW